MTAGVPHAGEEVIFVPGDGARFIKVGGQIGVVAVGEVDGLAVGGEGEGMGAVFAAAAHFAEVFDLVELVVAIGVAEAPDALLGGDFVDHDVEAVEGVEQAVGADRGGRGAVGGLGAFGRRAGLGAGRGRDSGERDGEFLDLGAGGGAEGWESDAVESAVLVGGGDAAFRIDGECDPGALFFFGNRVEELDLEAGGDLEFGGVGGDGEGGHLSAGGGGGGDGFGFALGFLLGGLRRERDGGEAEEEQRAEACEPVVEWEGGCHGLGKGMEKGERVALARREGADGLLRRCASRDDKEWAGGGGWIAASLRSSQ